MIDATPAKYNEFSFDNPFVDALPKPLTIEELAEKLSISTQLPSDYRNYPPQIRQQLNCKIKQLYFPTEYTADIYRHLYQGLVTAYSGRTIRSVVEKQDMLGGMLYENKRFNFEEDFQEEQSLAESFSVLGDAGTGKTSGVQKVLKCFPKIIEHTSYRGIPLECLQITYIMVECPPDYSPKSICLQILANIDRLIGTEFQHEAIKRQFGLDYLIIKIAQLCQKFSIGAIIIDEIQNILFMNSKAKNSNKFVKFLLELNNLTGVCLVCLGTRIVSPYFDASPHLARRTRGPRLAPFDNTKTFKFILEQMWNNAAVLNPTAITTEIYDTCYQITGGVLAGMASLIMKAADDAIFFQKEQITPELLKNVASKYGFNKKIALKDSNGTSNVGLLKSKNKSTVTISQNTLSEKTSIRLESNDNDLIKAFKNDLDILAFLKQKKLLLENWSDT